MMHRPTKDSVITIGILLLISLIFSILLYLDFKKKGGIGDNPIIGEVTFKERSVHRKIDSSVVWDEVEKSSPVANKDTIRTLEYSDAILTLNDGTKLRLSDNSMIYVDLSEKNLNIKFDYGSISTSRESGIESDTKLSINSGEKTIEIENGGVAKLSKNEDENVKVQVEKGKAILSLNGKEEILSSNQTAELREDKIDVRPIRFILQYPQDGKYFSTSNNKFNSEFKWSPVEKGVSVEIQIAKDKTFKQIIKNQSGIRDSSISFEINPGVYFWKISARNPLGGKKESSEIRKFTVFSERAVNIISPPNEKIFTYTVKIPSIALRWTKNDFSSSYKVDISSNPDFTSIVKSVDSFENYINTDIPAKGIYYVRVTTRPNIPDLNPVVSSISKFSIEERQLPYPPETISPIANSNFGLDFIRHGKILFNWRDNLEFKEYELEASKTIDFSAPFMQITTKSNFSSIDFKEQQAGEIFWRIRGVLPDGRKSEFSRINNFKITEPKSLKLLYPESLAELDMNSDKSVTFKWQRPETSGTFYLEVSSSSDFSNQILKEDEKVVQGYLKKIFLNTGGQYFWRLKLLSREGKEITKSEVNSFTILGSPTPTLISPINEANIDLANNQEINFNWAKDEKALSYKFELFDTNKGVKRLITEINTLENNFTFKDIQKLKDGNFTWAVSILYSKNNGSKLVSPPSSSNITIQTPKLEIPIPTPLEPVNNADIRMEEKEEVLFKWEKNNNAIHYQIDVQEKSTQRTKPVFQKQTTEPFALFEIPVTVGEGIYYWDLYIFYKGWDGSVMRSEPIRNEFTLKFPNRNPPLVTLQSPMDDSEIKPNENWQLPLSWEVNDRAISYNVIVSEFETNKPVFQETTERNGTSFLVSDSAIKPGKYTWSVSINYKAKDERIVKSPPKKRIFTLSMPSFDVPVSKAITPEADTVINPSNLNELEFKWEKSDSALLYSIEILEVTGENQILIAKTDTKENSFFFKDISRFKNGQYIWKLSASYKDRTLKTIKTLPLLTEFTINIPVLDIIEPPQILTKPRLYVE